MKKFKAELTLSKREVNEINNHLNMDVKNTRYQPGESVFFLSRTFDDGRFVWLGLIATEEAFVIRPILLHDVDTCSCEEISSLPYRNEVLGVYVFDYDDDVESETCHYELTVVVSK